MRTAFALLALLAAISGGSDRVFAASRAARDAPCWQGGTTAAIALCFAQAGKTSDDALNLLYGRIISVLGDSDRQQLQKTQRLWIAYRAASCDAERDLWEGGTGGNPAWLACVDDETRHRIDILATTYRLRLQRLAP